MKLGSAFSDNLIIEKKSVNRLDKFSHPVWWLGSGRTLLFASLLIFTFFVLAARLFDLTVMRGHHFRALAEENRVQERIRHAPRGILYDRTGRQLVSNVSNYRKIKPCENSTQCSLRVKREEGDELLENGMPPGEFLEIDFRREYPHGETVAHVIGYTGELTDEELADEYYSLRNYGPGDRIGRDGVEAVFEERLRGRDGKELIEVDAQGGMLRSLGSDPEVPGNDIHLSLDADLSDFIARIYPKDQKGAVVVSKPKSGEILAMYSSPSYNPNLFSAALDEQSYKLLFQNSDLPLFNRAIGGAYPPGSTFKLITSLAALSEDAINLNTTVEDVGVLRIGEAFTFPNWYFLKYGKTEGNIGLIRAIARSNDIFFYKTGEWLGISKLAVWARKFGVGRPLGIELAGEASGLMPDPDWKRSQFSTQDDIKSGHNLWYIGDTYHVSIGQGYLLTTPLHVNFWTSAVANGGNLCRPTIEKVNNIEKAARQCKNLNLQKKYIEAVAHGMVEACSPGGTGASFFNFSVGDPGTYDIPLNATEAASLKKNYVPVACKTGTAEFGDPEDKTHAWFTAFAPVPDEFISSGVSGTYTGGKKRITGDPEITVTVLLEAAGEGSEKAAPVAKEIFEYWFSR